MTVYIVLQVSVTRGHYTSLEGVFDSASAAYAAVREHYSHDSHAEYVVLSREVNRVRKV